MQLVSFTSSRIFPIESFPMNFMVIAKLLTCFEQVTVGNSLFREQLQFNGAKAELMNFPLLDGRDILTLRARFLALKRYAAIIKFSGSSILTLSISELFTSWMRFFLSHRLLSSLHPVWNNVLLHSYWFTSISS